MSEKFEFQPIEGSMSLVQAGEELVRIAESIQHTHDNNSASQNKNAMQSMFNMRKASLNSVMDLIQQYIKQMPDPDRKICGVCTDFVNGKNGGECGCPMVYINHVDNFHRTTDNTPACGYFFRKKEV